MASWEDLMGWGPYAQPAQQQQPSVMQNPAAQAALLSAALQAMTGGWGNGSQQAAQAIGAGAQGGGAYTQQERQRQVEDQQAAFRDAQLTASREDRASQRQTQLDVARIGAASRQEVAALRNEAALSRVDDRMRIAQMQNRRAAEANLQNAYQARLRSITADLGLMGNPTATRQAQDAARADLEAGMARLAQLYPLAGDAPAAVPDAAVPIARPPAGQTGTGGSSTVNPGVPPVVPAAPTAAPAAPAPVTQVPPPAGMSNTAAAGLNALLARAQTGDATARQQLQQLWNNPQHRMRLAPTPYGPQLQQLFGN